VPVVLVSIAAGVFIAGGPGVLGTTEATPPIVTSTSTTSTIPAAIPTLATIPPPPTSAITAPLTAITTTTSAATTSTSTSPPTVPPTQPLISHADLRVAVANGASIPMIATQYTDALEAIGYLAIDPVDTSIVPASRVYYEPGLQREASRLAVEAGLRSEAIATMDRVPELSFDGGYDLVLVLGTDTPPPLDEDSLDE
jgi:hypothetical protein